MILRRCDCDRQVFRSGGPGGQHQNKTESGVRYVHRPTGLVGRATDTRYQHKNDRLAWARLVLALQGISEARREAEATQRYRSKPRATFGSQVRTYRLGVDAPGVIDHRTGVQSAHVRAVLDGDLDPFLGRA